MKPDGVNVTITEAECDYFPKVHLIITIFLVSSKFLSI
jgi:hypothetical protein